jgi:hypothetical protein
MISRNKIAVVFFAIAIISIASYGYLYIKDHQDWRVTPELRVLPPYTAYDYYGVTDFIQGIRTALVMKKSRCFILFI